MLRAAFLALALASLACGAPADAPSSAGAPEAPQELWLAPGQLGYAEQQQWGLALPDGFGVIVLPAEVFAGACGGLPGHDGGPCAGSVVGAADLEGAAVLLRDDLTPALFRSTLLHEMGHILRGQGQAHIPEAEGCPERRNGQHVMCAWNGASEVTAEDLAFVVAGRGPLGWL